MGLAAKLRIIVVLICLAAAGPAVSAQNLKTFSGEYGPFNTTDYEIFEVVEPATIHQGALQVTPDSANSVVINLYNQSGRVLLKRQFKLWEGSDDSYSERIASFNSSFLINIFRENGTTAGEGLAFVRAPDLYLPPNGSGQYLGLTNSTTNGNATNRLVAIELDTFKEDFDPDANHVGLNINSVRSKKNTSLTPLGIEIAPEGGEAWFYNVWVQYDGVKKFIEVYIERQAEKDGQTPPRPAEPVLMANLDLRGVVEQYSYFGFSASTRNTKQLNCVLRWNLTVEHYQEDKHPWMKILLGAGVPILVVVVIGVAGLVYYLRKK